MKQVFVKQVFVKQVVVKQVPYWTLEIGYQIHEYEKGWSMEYYRITSTRWCDYIKTVTYLEVTSKPTTPYCHKVPKDET